MISVVEFIMASVILKRNNGLFASKGLFPPTMAVHRYLLSLACSRTLIVEDRLDSPHETPIPNSTHNGHVFSDRKLEQML
jgi:hypothetical protein